MLRYDSAMGGTRWALLPGMSVVAAGGRDARSFLQGQLTNDLLGIGRHSGLLAAACNRQGRVLALLRLALRDDAVLMLLPRAHAPLLIAHLARFVLRADVAFEQTDDAVAGLVDAPPHLEARAASAGLTVMVASTRRALIVGRGEAVESLLQSVARSTAGDWESACVADGEPMVYPETTGVWIPQMINLDLLGAVSFTKGCYLGQEIVARAQHLGRIRRRMLRYAGAAAPGPGAPLYLGRAQAAQVVRSGSAGAGGCLAVVALDQCGELLGAAPGGSEFVPAELPYTIPAAAFESEAMPAG
ncbi:MAG: CAF17-like 4Fe-4S cluster assembly/insertion protein YgfZ [Gammaproteobacteria bacterium]